MIGDHHSFANFEQGKIEHIDFDFSIDFSTKTVGGMATYRMHKPVQSPLYLDTRDIKIEHIYTDKQDCDWVLDKQDEILGERLIIHGLDQDTSFSIEFQTSPQSSALQWLSPQQTFGKRHPFLYSQCQPLHARSIFPCQDSPSVRFTYSAAMQVPYPLGAVMSAESKEVLREGQINTCLFEMPQAIPSYLFALSVGNIAHKDLGARSRVYGEPEVIESAAHEFAEIESMIVEAEKLFGPYIWDRYDMIVLPPSFPYGGMENPRLTFLTPTLIVGDRSLVNVLTHEMAHSWTGNLVTNATWDDLWLNEGWTVYAEHRILEKLYGPDFSQMQATLRQNKLLDDMKLFGMDSDPTRLKFSKKGIDPDAVLSSVPYGKGAALITLLEEAVGREIFDPFIQNYIHTFKFQSITTEEFLTFLRKELPQVLEKVNVDEWIYEPGLPDNAPEFHSALIEDVETQLTLYQKEQRPPSEAISGWEPQQVELFLRRLPDKIPTEDCQYFEELFGLNHSRNFNHLTRFFEISIRSQYRQILDRVEEFLGSFGRMLYLKPLYRALNETTWCKPEAQRIFKRFRDTYHPIAVSAIERVLNSGDKTA
jgi:leukotriene A-4 hydrolase/aminopeptidase